MQCLVTGGAGFAGSHLTELLAAGGHTVTVLAMPGEDLRRLNGIRTSIDVRVADVTDRQAIRETVESLKPDVVFHLAAIASVATSFGAPSLAFRVNTQGTINLLEALRTRPPKKFIYISSADIYGHVPARDIPIREDNPPKPVSPYAASKAAAELACLQYWRTFALPTVILRPFNHTGPRQGPGFAPSDFASAIARIEKGLDPPRLAVGNLESYRDYSDVRDIVKAYAAAAQRCEAGEIYNISSGNAVKIGDLLAALLSRSKTEIKVAADASRSRPSDTPVVAGDHSKFTRRTGWQPQIPLDTTLTDLVEWWRKQV